MTRRLTLSDDDIGNELVALANDVVHGELASLEVGNAVGAQLPLPGCIAIGERSVVVLGCNDNAGLVVGQVRDNVASTLVVVHAESDDEVLASVCDEAKGAAGAAATHGEDLGAVDLGPSAAVGVLPDRLLNNLEERVRVGLVDFDGDGVGHPASEIVSILAQHHRVNAHFVIG